MSSLYVSDLDGTLLRSNETTSEYTNTVTNRLTEGCIPSSMHMWMALKNFPLFPIDAAKG